MCSINHNLNEQEEDQFFFLSENLIQKQMYPFIAFIIHLKLIFSRKSKQNKKGCFLLVMSNNVFTFKKKSI
jgi:hypothetical protein